MFPVAKISSDTKGRGREVKSSSPLALENTQLETYKSRIEGSPTIRLIRHPLACEKRLLIICSSIARLHQFVIVYNISNENLL